MTVEIRAPGADMTTPKHGDSEYTDLYSTQRA